MIINTKMLKRNLKNKKAKYVTGKVCKYNKKGDFP